MIERFVDDLLKVQITSSCKSPCNNPCQFKSDTPEHISIDNFKKALSENDNLNVLLFGGEPFEHPDIIELIKIARNDNRYVIIATHGRSQLVQKKIQSIKSDNVEIMIKYKSTSPVIIDNLISIKSNCRLSLYISKSETYQNSDVFHKAYQYENPFDDEKFKNFNHLIKNQKTSKYIDMSSQTKLLCHSFQDSKAEK